MASSQPTKKDMSNHKVKAPDTGDVNACPAPTPLNEDQQEVSKMLRGLHHHPDYFERGMGGIALGEDGILRSLTADREVVDAVAFSPGHLEAWLDRLPVPFDQELEDV
jgi:hypothetical protein